MSKVVTGALRKMTAERKDTGEIEYHLPVGEQSIALNPLIGQSLTFIYSNEIRCRNCDRKTKKSYSQGFCFPCMQKTRTM